VSVGRSVIPIKSDFDADCSRDANEDQVGGSTERSAAYGRTYTGEPERIATELARDQAVAAADTLLLTVRASSAWTTTCDARDDRE